MRRRNNTEGLSKEPYLPGIDPEPEWRKPETPPGMEKMDKGTEVAAAKVEKKKSLPQEKKTDAETRQDLANADW